MTQVIGAFSLVVRDYDEAIDYYRSKMGFRLVEDTPLPEGKRWVLMEPSGGGCRLLLAKAANARQEACVGCQAGGRVFLFLNTDDFEADFAAMKQKGVRFLEEPRHEQYGSVAVFEDFLGNRWDLIEPRRAQQQED